MKRKLFCTKKKEAKVDPIQDLYKRNAKLMSELLETKAMAVELMDIASEQQKAINELQRQHNELVRLIAECKEES